MSQEENEQATFQSAVQAEVAKQVAELQRHFAQVMESAVRVNLQGLDLANANLNDQSKILADEIDAARQATKAAQASGEKIAEAYFQASRAALQECARQSLLRELTWQHVQAGRAVEDICQWLGVGRDYVQRFVERMDRKAESLCHTREQNRIELEFNPRLRYVSQGRSGSIIFQNDHTSFEMWWEFGGGNVLAIIDVPTESQWTGRTKLPLEHRDGVLRFIAEQVVDDQAGGRAGYEIGDGVITIFV